MATGQQGFDPDDFVRRDSEQNERRREQDRIDSMRRERTRMNRDESMQRREEMSSMRKMMDVINDSNIQVDQDLVKAINDPMVVMTEDGQLARLTGRQGIRRSGQFNFQNLLPRTKRKRKKNGNDKKLSEAFKQANARYRTKSGKLRKGRTQADIARLAQRLRKKM